jgi:translation initiation factor eIF-2B subunit alpha
LQAFQELKSLNITACVVPDSAIAHVMHKADMVFVGAEAVVQNGGIINQIGTYQISIVAKACNKPFYCVTERFCNLIKLQIPSNVSFESR